MDAFKPHLSGLAAYPYRKVEAAIKLDQNESPWDLPEDLKNRALERMRHAPWNRYPDMHAEGVRALRRAIPRLARGGDRRRARVELPHARAGPGGEPGPRHVAVVRVLRGSRAGDRDAVHVGAAGAGLRASGGRAGPRDGPGGRRGWCSSRRPTRRPARSSRCRTWPGWPRRPGSAGGSWPSTRPTASSPAPTSVRWPGRIRSVVILRTFSKAFGLGGVRAGFLLAVPDVAVKLQAMLPPFDVPVHTAAVLETVLESPGRAAEVGVRLAAERDRVIAEPRPSPDMAPAPEPRELLPRSNPGRRGRVAVPPGARDPRPASGPPPRT